MRTIRKKISRPFLIIIVLIPLSILILFNLLVKQYSSQQAQDDLLKAVDSIATSLEQDNIQSLADILKNQDHSSSAELLVYNKSGKLSKNFNKGESFLDPKLANLIYEESLNLLYHEIGSFNYEGTNYYIVSVEFETQTPTDKIVYVSRGLIIDDFVNQINFILMAVSVIITLIALIVSFRITKSIAKPIENLTYAVENMNSNELIKIDNKSDSLEIAKLTAEINALNKRIYHYNESQKSFLQNASHELRTPLMSIMGYADGIEMDVFKDYKGTAHLISDQCKRLTSLVDSLLSLSRAENFNTNKKLESICLSEAVIDITNQFKGYCTSNNIVLDLKISPEVYVLATTELLSASIGNILSNAIRYASSKVSIQLFSDAKIKISDDGNGIENLETIFEKFSKGKGGNFGLGLSIAKTSCEMMNAEIIAYNDKGAVFEINFLN